MKNIPHRKLFYLCFLVGKIKMILEVYAVNRIRKLREDHDMTQEELAARLGAANNAVISRYENGTRALNEESLRIMSIIFGVSTDYILGLSDDPNGGTSRHRPNNIQWDALELIDAANELSDDERKVLMHCVRYPDALGLVQQYLKLTPKSKRRAVEYLDMLKLHDEAKKSAVESEE